MKFAASDSLSELVWSKREGLSLKSVYCSESDKKPVIVWNFGQSNVPLSPSRSVKSTNTDEKQVVERNFIISCANSYIDGTVDQRAFPSYKDTARPIIGSGGHKRSTDNSPKMDKETSKGGDLPSQKSQIDKNLGDIEEKEVSSAVNFLEAGIGDGTQGEAVAGHSDQIISLQGGKESKFVITMPGKLNRGTTSNATYICNDANGGGPISKDANDREAALHVEEQRKEKMKLPSLNTLEFSAENDFHLINRVNFLPSEERLLRSSSVPLETSPIIKSQWKGQKKAVSDGNLDGRFINAPDDSYQSEESCNSVRFVSKGKRKCEFQENLMAESKRIKKQVDGISASTSVIRPGSSFLNWIVNVVKGSSKANKEGAPSLELSHGSSLHKPNTCSERHNPTKKSIGFRNVLESLYTSNAKLSESRSAIDRSVERACSGKVNLTNSPEICTAESCDLNKVSDECILRSSTTVACQSGHIDSATNNLGANLEENKATCISCDGIGGKSAGEGGENKSNLISSLWITRFSPPTGSSSLSVDRGKRTNSGVPKCPCNSTTVHTLPEPNCSTKAKCSDAGDNSNKRTSGDSSCEDLQLATKKESCGAIEEIYGHNPQSHAPPAGNFRNSEATAFMFPRRLDALKCLVPSGSKDHGTCFFCGKRLGSTSCCSHVNEAEQECSQRYDNSYNGAEDTIHSLPVPCIRCFQINHLAVSCPIGSSRQKPLQTNVRRWASQIFKKNMDDCFLEKLDDYQGVHYHSSNTFFEGDVEDQLTTGKEFFASGGFDSSGTKKQKMNSDKQSLVVHHFLPVHTVNDAHPGDLPREMFNAVKRLQVSRTDMLKLMNSRVLLPHIEGFFLRLRLGKWEAGLGGTGYHVACITVGKSTKDGQNCLYVDVGGIKCPVGSQHVSNHGFTEEELMTWWCRSMRTGGKIPSKDDLASKISQRFKLGI